MKRLSRVTEPEVIADFLRGEFYHQEYDVDREQFASLVLNPKVEDAAENALRRALLFRRRATMWRELPDDTQWWEVELEKEDLARINIFPRAQWRSLGRGNYQALHIAELVRGPLQPGTPNIVASKIQTLSALLQYENQRSTILLIALDEKTPATVLEGNHRFVASLLLPREIMTERLRMVCGFSPLMEKCCWYRTSLPNLFRYLKNRIKHIGGSEADTRRWFEQATQAQAAKDLAHSAGMHSAESD